MNIAVFLCGEVLLGVYLSFRKEHTTSLSKALFTANIRGTRSQYSTPQTDKTYYSCRSFELDAIDFFSAYLEEQEDSDSDASPGFQAPRPKRGKRQKPPAVSDDSSGPRLQSRPAIRRAAAIARSRIVENET